MDKFGDSRLTQRVLVEETIPFTYPKQVCSRNSPIQSNAFKKKVYASSFSLTLLSLILPLLNIYLNPFVILYCYSLQFSTDM